jgi:hypothetical protein
MTGSDPEIDRALWMQYPAVISARDDQYLNLIFLFLEPSIELTRHAGEDA